MTPATAVGWKAHAALVAAGGRTVALPGFARSAYRLAAGELVWLGDTTSLHPRAVVVPAVARPAQPAGVEGIVAHAVRVDGLVPWRAALPQLDRAAARQLVAGCVALVGALSWLGRPRGLAELLAGGRPAFPLDHADAHVDALARAIDGDDPSAAAAAALPLLGLGPGLTPSGDDFVGAVLFARRVLGMNAGWAQCAQRLVAASRSRTHAIAAALFEDLAAGESHAPLHALAAALAAGAAGTDAARELCAIGHSSGWDMLAGFIVGAAGGAALQRGVS